MLKKGQVKTLWLVFGVILAGIAAWIIIGVIMSAAGLTGGKAEAAARGNLERLEVEINNFLEEEKDFHYTITSDLNIPAGFILVGFDSEWKGAENPAKASNCPLFVSEGIDKPSTCGKNGCVCLYRDTTGDDFMGDGEPEIVHCIPVAKDDKKIMISAPADNYYNINNCEEEKSTLDYDNDCLNDGAEKNPEIIEYFGSDSFRYEFFVVYGKCGGSWGTRPLYIEKFEKGDTLYLFMGVEEYKELRGEKLKEKIER